MNLITGLIVTLAIVAIGVSLYLYVFKDDEAADRPTFEEQGTVDQELSEAPEDFDIDSIPEEDQEYLIPILSNMLQEFIPIKVRYPSNALLIEHLGISLGKAVENFEKRKKKTDPIQTENREWLKVAAWAIRLYKEGTVHNSEATRERFTMIANLSERELKAYATATMNQAGKKIHKELEGEDPDESTVREEKAPDVGNNMQPYTESEIQDMKDAADEDMGEDDNDDKIIKP